MADDVRASVNGVQYSADVVVLGDAGSGSAGTVGVKPVSSATATTPTIAASATSITLMAANGARLPGSTIANESSSILYILLGSGTAAANNYTVAIDAKSNVAGVYFLPDGYVGQVKGIWAVASGSAQVTEITA